jgi:hypothetical protein
MGVAFFVERLEILGDLGHRDAEAECKTDDLGAYQREVFEGGCQRYRG